MPSAKWQSVHQIKPRARFAGFFRLFTQIVLDGFSLILPCSLLLIKMFLISILISTIHSENLLITEPSAATAGHLWSPRPIYICPIGPCVPIHHPCVSFQRVDFLHRSKDRISNHFSQYSSTVGFSLWKTTSPRFSSGHLPPVHTILLRVSA